MILASRGACDIRVIGRPEHDVAKFNDIFPTETHDLCFPRPHEGQQADFDKHRDVQLPRILGRDAVFVTTYFTCHNSQIIAEAEKAGSEIWRRYMTPQTYQHFLNIDGPDRLAQ